MPFSDSISVSNLDFFRAWQDDEDMPLGMLMARLLGTAPQSDAMKAGNAFHEALERSGEGDIETLTLGDYRFDFNCDCRVERLEIHELPVEKMYGNLRVRGRVDGLNGKEVTDYKTMSQFDADRLMSGYQWRFYLDMLECDQFRWEVFVIAERSPFCYEVTQAHTLTQRRYPNLGEDCARLARRYSEFIRNTPFEQSVAKNKELLTKLTTDITTGEGTVIGQACKV